jgi:hypothetical protein
MRGINRWAFRLGLAFPDRNSFRRVKVDKRSVPGLTEGTGDAGEARWPQVDEPIGSAASDRLGRSPFAKRAAQVLGELQSLEESSVLALVGPWGSGKTSIINLICEELADWKVCRSNMWAPPDMAGLLADLFATIHTALPEGEQAGRLKGLLSEYAQLAIPALTLIPTVGNAAGGIASNVVALRAQRPMQPLFDQLTTQVRRLGLRVLVVLDDVDRLQPDELLMLFKAIRLVARFPGVYYLLAYDEQTVIDLLTSTPIAAGSPERALAYLEKIVQVRLDLPPAQRFYTERMLGDGITALLGRLGTAMTDEQASRFRELHDSLLQLTLAQPRAVGRFLRQAVAYLPMTEPGELDVVDFLTLTHVRSLTPGTYQVLARSKEWLTAQPGSNAETTRDTVREQLTGRIGEECGDLSDRVLAAVTELFPAIDDDYLNRLGPVDWQQRAAARRASVEEYFDRYFLFGLPVGDIADSTAREALAAIAQGEETPALTEVKARITGPDREVASRVIRKLARLSVAPDILDPSSIEEVLRFALSLPGWDASPGDSLLGSTGHQGIAWATQLLARIGHPNLRLDPGVTAVLDDAAFARLCQALRQAALAPGDQSQALLDAYDQIAADARTRVRSHLRERDGASLSLPVERLVQFINRSTARAELAEMISADLNDGQYMLADLASRFVTIGRFSHDGDELIGFDDESLISLMGLSELWKLATADHDLDAAAVTVDENDTSWPSRRNAGLVQLDRALRQRRAAPPVPPSGVRRVTMGHNPGQQTGPRQWASRIDSVSSAGDKAKRLLCIRAAVLLPGTAQGLPSGQGSVDVWEDVRAQALAKILAEVPLTTWCQSTALSRGLDLAPQWAEEGFGSLTYAELALSPRGSDVQPPLRAYCAIITGQSRRGEPDTIALALDLLLHFPFPFPHSQEPTSITPLIAGDKLSLRQLTELAEMVTQSAIQAARRASSTLLNTSPPDGHVAIWLTARESLDQVIDLEEFPMVGNQSAQTEASIFADLPIEPGQAIDSADFTRSLHGATVELAHELLRTSRRRNFIEALHALRDASYD